jgi:aminopeptidase-like protein
MVPSIYHCQLVYIIFFSDWLKGINRKLKSKIIVGASALCSTIWLSRNDIVFNKTVALSYLQAIFRGPTGPGFGSCYRRRRRITSS